MAPLTWLLILIFELTATKQAPKLDGVFLGYVNGEQWVGKFNRAITDGWMVPFKR